MGGQDKFFYTFFTNYIQGIQKKSILVARPCQAETSLKIKHVRYVFAYCIHIHMNLNFWRQISFINPLHLPDRAKLFLHSNLNFCNRGYFSEFVENISWNQSARYFGMLQEFLCLKSWGYNEAWSFDKAYQPFILLFK